MALFLLQKASHGAEKLRMLWLIGAALGLLLAEGMIGAWQPVAAQRAHAHRIVLVVALVRSVACVLHASLADPSGAATADQAADQEARMTERPNVPVSERPAATSGAPAQAPSPAPGMASGGVRVLLLGDSLAQGLGPCLAPLANDVGLDLRTVGVKGSTIRHWLQGSTLADAVSLASPLLTLVSLGTNDMVVADAAAEGRRAGELIDALDRLDAGVVRWIGPPSLPVDKSAFRAALAAACSQRNVRIFDSQALQLARAPDHIHMTPAGYRAWAASIATWVPFAGFRAGAAPVEPSPPPPPPRDPDEGRAPVYAPATLGHIELREPIVVARLGALGLDDYIAHVVTGELGNSRQIEALKAQAIAARTYVQRALRDDPALGTAAKPVPNGETFQVAAAVAIALPRRAAEETHGGVAFYRGRLIFANYVAGAPWAPGAWKGTDGPKYPTEKHVTYNAGRVGTSVLPTGQADPRRADNRGSMSQNGADALASRGWKWPRILRFFYGDDLEFTIPEPADPTAGPPAPTPKTPSRKDAAPPKDDADAGPLLVAATVAAFRIFG